MSKQSIVHGFCTVTNKSRSISINYKEATTTTDPHPVYIKTNPICKNLEDGTCNCACPIFQSAPHEL